MNATKYVTSCNKKGQTATKSNFPRDITDKNLTSCRIILKHKTEPLNWNRFDNCMNRCKS